MNKRLFKKLKNWSYNGLSNEEKIKSHKEKIKLYNEDPFYCKHCGKAILIESFDELKDRMKAYENGNNIFCSSSHAAIYNNKNGGEERYKKRAKSLYKKLEEYKFPDSKIKEAFNKSKSIKEFLRNLGLKKKYITTYLIDKCEQLGLDLEHIKVKPADFSKITKKELYDKGYAYARSAITTNAKSIYDKSKRQTKCCNCEWDIHIDIAHIKAVSEFSDKALISTINNIDNLAPLCPNCHYIYDKTKGKERDEVKNSIDKWLKEQND